MNTKYLVQKSPEYSSTFPKVPELVSILICDLEKSKQANLAKNPLGGSGAGGAALKFKPLISTGLILVHGGFGYRRYTHNSTMNIQYEYITSHLS